MLCHVTHALLKTRIHVSFSILLRIHSLRERTKVQGVKDDLGMGPNGFLGNLKRALPHYDVIPGSYAVVNTVCMLPFEFLVFHEVLVL